MLSCHSVPTALGALPINILCEIWKMFCYLATGDSGYELKLQNLVQIQWFLKTVLPFFVIFTVWLGH